MTRARASSRSPRAGAPTTAAPIVALLVGLLVILAAACGSTGPSASGASPSAASPSVVSGSAGPSGPSGPAPTRWPGSAVEAIKALGAADTEISKFLADFTTAIESNDLPAMWGAADGLAKMLEGLMPNIDRLANYPPMQPLADAYRGAFPAALDAAKLVRDSIDAGDAQGISRGSVALFEALGDYAALKPDLAAWVEQSLLQQRLLTN